MKRETTTPKPLENTGEAAVAVESSESESESESGVGENNVSEDEDTTATNGRGAGSTAGPIPVVSAAERGALVKKCRRVLDTQMNEIGHVFDNGMDGVSYH
jgi:hypothetical protein